MRKFLFFGLALILVFSSCVLESDDEILFYPTIKSVGTEVVVPYERNVELGYTSEDFSEITVESEQIENNKFIYQWYESADGTTETGTPIKNATSSTYVVPKTAEKGFRYYYRITYDESSESIGEIITVACTGLPLVLIDTVNKTSPTTAKEKNYGRLQIFYPDKTNYDSGTSNEFSIKVRGNATSGYPKKPYKLKLPKKKNLIDIKSNENKDKNWVLLAGYCDKTLLRSKIGFFTASLFNKINDNEKLYVPHSSFVDVVLNGEYLGNYTLTDSVKEGESRLSVNEKTTDDGGIGFVSEWDSGYYARESKWFKTSLKTYPYTFKFPDTNNSDFDTYMSYFEKYMNDFEDVLYYENSDDWKNYIDVESFARWFLTHNILANIDTNYFFSKKTSDNSSKLVMGPVWDFEWSIGIGWYYGERPRSSDYWCVNGWYFNELLKKTDFVSEVKSQWAKLLLLYPDLANTINSKMDEFANEIEMSQRINFIKWNILNQQVSVGGIPLGSYKAELECDKQFMKNRITWLDSAISGL